jgi:hypothetical protein
LLSGAGRCRQKTGRPAEVGTMGMPKRHGDLHRQCEQSAPGTKSEVGSNPAHACARLGYLPAKSMPIQNNASPFCSLRRFEDSDQSKKSMTGLSTLVIPRCGMARWMPASMDQSTGRSPKRRRPNPIRERDRITRYCQVRAANRPAQTWPAAPIGAISPAHGKPCRAFAGSAF